MFINARMKVEVSAFYSLLGVSLKSLLAVEPLPAARTTFYSLLGVSWGGSMPTTRIVITRDFLLPFGSFGKLYNISILSLSWAFYSLLGVSRSTDRQDNSCTC